MNKLIAVAAFLTFSSYFMTPTLAQEETVPAEVLGIGQDLKARFAPDKRVALFDVDYSLAGEKKLLLRGVTTSGEAKDELLSSLKERGYEVVDSLRLLPDEKALDGKTYGIINLSVASLRIQPDYSSEMMTQALLGMPVRLLERDGWYRVQTPDDYIAWTHRVSVLPVTREELTAWNRAKKLVITAHYGFVYSEPDRRSQTVSDIVAGNRLKLEGTKGDFYRVSYPDGRRGYVEQSAALPEREWRKDLKQDAASIIRTAYTLMGVPYLWAGTSSKGVDCSGFVRTVLYLHDIIIPRDASQQAYVGQHIDIAPDFSNLEPGDLIFFGRKATAERKERVVHVALYVGGKRFIHSQGDVHVSSFDPQDELFDAYNLGRLLFAVRVLPSINQEKGLNTTDRNPYYQW